MPVRVFLLVSAISLLLVPAGAVASGQTPGAAGYSAADVPGLPAVGPGFSADDGAAARVPGVAGTAPGLAANAPGVAASAPGLAANVPGDAANVPGLADEPATGACATRGGRPASASPRESGHGAETDSAVLGSGCTGQDQATACPSGDAAEDSGSLASASTIMTRYDRDRSGAYRYDGYLSATVVDRGVARADGVQGGGRTVARSGQLVNPNLLLFSSSPTAAPARARAACVPCPVSLSAGAAKPLATGADSSLVLRLPFSAGIAEAGFLGILLTALACGASAVISRRRRRSTRPAPW